MPEYDWKNLSMQINTGIATFGPIVPAMMHMQIKEIAYSNRTAAVNRVQLAQIPSGTVRPSHSIMIDDETLASQTPYSPRIARRIVQENHCIQALSSAGPAEVNITYRLVYGRP